jgi:ADP-ribose pyrophosphatase YjhB (NUDIX family)
MKSPVISIDILIIRNNKVLLGLFTEEWSYQGKATYGLPGREIKFGETFSQAIERDVKEELDCKLLDHSIIAVNANYAFDNHYVGIGATAIIEGEPQVTKPEDWRKWEWFALGELSVNLFPPAKNLIDSYRSSVFTVSD